MNLNVPGQVFISDNEYLVTGNFGNHHFALELQKTFHRSNARLQKLIKVRGTRFLEFKYYQCETRKTPIITITHKIDGYMLGTIMWYGRGYWFSSMMGLRYDTQCLKDITEVIAELTKGNEQHD